MINRLKILEKKTNELNLITPIVMNKKKEILNIIQSIKQNKANVYKQVVEYYNILKLLEEIKLILITTPNCPEKGEIAKLNFDIILKEIANEKDDLNLTSENVADLFMNNNILEIDYIKSFEEFRRKTLNNLLSNVDHDNLKETIMSNNFLINQTNSDGVYNTISVLSEYDVENDTIVDEKMTKLQNKIIDINNIKKNNKEKLYKETNQSNKLLNILNSNLENIIKLEIWKSKAVENKVDYLESVLNIISTISKNISDDEPLDSFLNMILESLKKKILLKDTFILFSYVMKFYYIITQIINYNKIYFFSNKKYNYIKLSSKVCDLLKSKKDEFIIILQ